jgi:MoaA/NifB/PqqE/SkfB family radical SAM enzyme
MGITESYTAADTFPTKLIQNQNVIGIAGKIKPYHIQLYPTNVCNLKCDFCSCANRGKKDELSIEQINSVLNTAWKLGCRAVTISGGGEPTLHPNINEILEKIKYLGMQAGITSNGTTLDRVTDENLSQNLTWLRISHSDLREWTSDYRYKIANIVKKCSGVDWGFSYVITNNINYEMLKNLVIFSNANKAAYVRIVSDLLNLDDVGDMASIREYLHTHNVDDSIVIYQGRKNFHPGVEKCLISLLKPVINADGYIYGCCGIQYSKKEPDLELNKNMAMGRIEDLYDIYYKQKYFNGNICVKCYYSDYNFVLDKLTTKIKHEDFL